MPAATPLETEFVRHLVRFAGKDGAPAFSAVAMPNEMLLVRGPQGAAYYQLEGWSSRFMRHLHTGYFHSAPAVAAPHSAYLVAATG